MNRLLTAQESLWDSLAYVFDPMHVAEFKRIMNPIFHLDEDMPLSDPNHATSGFSGASQATRNMTRVKRMMSGVPLSSDLQAIHDHLFDRTTDAYSNLGRVIRAFVWFRDHDSDSE